MYDCIAELTIYSSATYMLDILIEVCNDQCAIFTVKVYHNQQEILLRILEENSLDSTITVEFPWS